jgi:hypothetical protein
MTSSRDRNSVHSAVVTAGDAAVAAEFRARPGEIPDAHQVPWPDALDTAVTAHQAWELGW